MEWKLVKVRFLAVTCITFLVHRLPLVVRRVAAFAGVRFRQEQGTGIQQNLFECSKWCWLCECSDCQTIACYLWPFEFCSSSSSSYLMETWVVRLFGGTKKCLSAVLLLGGQPVGGQHSSSVLEFAEWLKRSSFLNSQELSLDILALIILPPFSYERQ